MSDVKIHEKAIEPEDAYNMDEKGLVIGHSSRDQRILSKAAWQSERFKQAPEDGSREWLTLVACVGASRVILPPARIPAGDGKNIRHG